MTMVIPKEKMEVYRRSAQRRLAERARRFGELCNRALAAARRAADLLKEEYGVKDVYLFGSLAEESSFFDDHSDVDLAVRGLDEKIYLRVLSRLLDVDHTFDVDLIEMETAPESLVHKIENEGILL